MSTTQLTPSPTPAGDQVTTPSSTSTDAAARWKLATRVVFRFCFVYFTLYCLCTQIIEAFVPLPSAEEWPDPSTLPPMRQLVYWTATHVFHVKTALVNSGSGSGDKTWDWVLMFCLLVISLVATAIWSALDRQRPNYVTLHKWFRLGLRFALASQMLAYGLDKAVPLQMPFPYLHRLLEPYGNRSPMGVLWDSIGASPGYEIFAGCAETFGGILLFFPRTTLFGALVCLADTVQVFMLNITYDVPVKLFSFHLILISLVLLAPELRRLVNFFFGNHAVQPSRQPVIGRTQKRARIAVALQAALGLWLLGANAYGSWKLWHQYGGGRPKSVLYGIWDIEEFSQDGNLRAPLVTDNERFRRAIFDFTDRMQFEKMDNTFASYGAVIDDGKKTMTLTKSSDKNFKASFTYHRDGDQLTFDGDMDQHKLHLKLYRVDHTKFLLVSRGFHWVQEYPFNR
jgi:uncharacterized membrane protein YphA (DoxX/SURF4 family)